LIVITALILYPAGVAFAQAAPLAQAGAELESQLKDSASKGLRWLAAQQNERGRFVDANATVKEDVALTALSGLAMLASGSEPGKGEYGKPLQAVVAAVLASQQPSGLFVQGKAAGPMYGHGYATLFLAEAQRKHPDGAVRKALEKSVALLGESQNNEGGWRYQPKPLDADVSVTACELNALLAARAAGIAVDDKLVANAVAYIRRCQNPDGGFSYMAGQGVNSGFPRSAAGVAVLIHGGAVPAADAELRRGIQYLTRTLGAAVPKEGHYFYGRYYASQWLSADPAASRERRDALARELLDAQQRDGSWKEDSFSPVYSTASALIILQAPQKQLWIFGAAH
jgi:hypothetical protein